MYEDNLTSLENKNMWHHVLWQGKLLLSCNNNTKHTYNYYNVFISSQLEPNNYSKHKSNYELWLSCVCFDRLVQTHTDILSHISYGYLLTLLQMGRIALQFYVEHDMFPLILQKWIAYCVCLRCNIRVNRTRRLWCILYPGTLHPAVWKHII